MTLEAEKRGPGTGIHWFDAAPVCLSVSRDSASTAFTFADFNIDKPRVASVLSVADTIKLEYDFKLAPKS